MKTSNTVVKMNRTTQRNVTEGQAARAEERRKKHNRNNRNTKRNWMEI